MFNGNNNSSLSITTVSFERAQTISCPAYAFILYLSPKYVDIRPLNTCRHQHREVHSLCEARVFFLCNRSRPIVSEEVKHRLPTACIATVSIDVVLSNVTMNVVVISAMRLAQQMKVFVTILLQSVT